MLCSRDVTIDYYHALIPVNTYTELYKKLY